MIKSYLLITYLIIYSTITMYAEPSVKHLQDETQRIVQDDERIRNLYTYLPQAGEMSEQQNEQEGIRMMDLLKDAIHKDNPKWKLKEMSQQEMVQGVKFVELIKKGYLVLQQQKQNFQNMIQPVEQLNQAKEQLQQTNKQQQAEKQQQAKEQLQQAKKQQRPMQDQFKLLYDQKGNLIFEFDMMMLHVARSLKLSSEDVYVADNSNFCWT